MSWLIETEKKETQGVGQTLCEAKWQGRGRAGRQGRAGHGTARNGRERPDRTRHRTAGQGKSGHDKAGQGRAGYGAGLERMGQNKSEAGCKAEQIDR